MPHEDLPRFFADWLPGGVLSDVGPIDGQVEDLYPEEAALVARAVAVRRDEFATGRLRARALLQRLGCAPAPLLSNPDRSPQWPVGVIGAITHTRGLCGVAVAAAGGALLGLGIDIERAAPLEDNLAEYVLTADERRRLAVLEDAGERARQGMVAFCVKEAIHKCLHPVGNAGLEFSHVDVELPARGPSVGVRPGPEMARRIPADAALECGFEWAGGYVLAAALLRRR